VRTWTLEPGFPVQTPNSRGHETMVLDQDTTGRLWTSWEGGGSVWVAWSTSADHTQWSSPLSIRSGLDSDDITSVVSFGSSIGVFWSDQNRDEFGFRVHHDSNVPETWESVEIADAGSGHADDHICVKASGRRCGSGWAGSCDWRWCWASSRCSSAPGGSGWWPH
jgi:hypothetical protein